MSQKLVKSRDSNFELLRIIAISMVLVLHADFFSLNGPSVSDKKSDWFGSSLRIFFQALTVPAVNIFVMISGYYGISHSKRGIFNLLFQTFFYLILVYAVCIACCLSQFTVTGVKDLFMLTPGNWFLKSYILLYIIAPVLNAFVKTASRQQFRFILIAYYAFMLLYGWLFPKSTDYIAGGYSPISFIWLYLLARYIRLYPICLSRMKFRTNIVLLAAIMIFIVCTCMSACYMGGSTVYGYILLNYLSPTTVATAIFAIIITSRIKISSKLINRLAASSFAVYLVYVNPNILTRYRIFFNDLFHVDPTPVYWLEVFGLVVVMYLVVALIDTVRIFLWKRIERKCLINENR